MERSLSSPLPKLGFIGWLGIIIAGISCIIVYRRYFSPISEIPGPFLASFSRLWHLARLLEGNQNTALIALHDKHGHFVRIAHNEVSVSHPDAVRKILLAPLHKGSWYSIIAFPDRRYQNPMSTTDPKKKVERSRNLAAGYSIANLLQSEGAVDRNIGLLCGWLDKAADARAPVHLDQLFAYATNDNAGEFVLSQSFGFLERGADIGGTIKNSLAHNAYVAIMGFYGWVHTVLIGNPLVTWLGVLPLGHIIDSSARHIKEREHNEDARFDLMSHWLKALRENPDRMTVYDVHSAVYNNLAAGADTVAGGLQSFVYHTIRHPDAWRRCREEIAAAGLDGSGHVISFSDAQKLPYLQACITEALRIFSPAPMGLPRVVGPEGLTIGGQTFPRGTTVSVSAHVIHASKEIWGPTAREFRPERWLSSSAEDDRANNKMQRYWIPFGAGYASCPGQNIARIQLSKIAATLVRDYDIRQKDPRQDWTYKAYFTVVPRGWPVIVKKSSENDDGLKRA
ncbi:cytochrome P450 [Pestalotiopsis sp. NC0098]|nr:cytochrome P450 [Pestalotiopsis sp. NC0098]